MKLKENEDYNPEKLGGYYSLKKAASMLGITELALRMRVFKNFEKRDYIKLNGLYISKKKVKKILDNKKQRS